MNKEEDCRIREKIKGIEEALSNLKRHVNKTSDNEYVDYVKEIICSYNVDSQAHKITGFTVGEGNSKKVVMIDFDDSIDRFLIVGSDLTERLNTQGFNIVAVDHQKSEKRYRIWVEYKKCC